MYIYGRPVPEIAVNRENVLVQQPVTGVVVEIPNPPGRVAGRVDLLHEARHELQEHWPTLPRVSCKWRVTCGRLLEPNVARR